MEIESKKGRLEMNKRFVAVLIIFVLAFSFGGSPSYVAADDDNGPLTPGYWKQTRHFSAWTDYSPDTTISDVFDKASGTMLGKQTLMEALSFNGGTGSEGANRILMRAAVAALLNAKHPEVDYPLATTEIIQSVNGAINPGDRDEVIDLADELDAYNNGES
jgi:hypothetical protein